MKVSLVGASGLVGSQFLALALESERITKVLSIGRRPLVLKNPKLEERLVDFEALIGNPAQWGGDLGQLLVIALGSTLKKAGSREAFRRIDHDYVVACARAAREQGVQRILVITAIGADSHSRVFYNRIKGEVERDVIALRFVSTHFFRPSILLGERSEPRPGERFALSVMPILSLALQGPLRRYRAVESGRVAESLLEACFDSRSGVFFHESEEFQSP